MSTLNVASINGAPLGGFRNLLINGNPVINQRGYVSGTATNGANQYTLDRWRVVTSGQSISFTDSQATRTVTAPAGGVEQVIEGESIITGTYVLSWEGTATATVNGAAATNGVSFSLTGGSNCTVRFSNGTFRLAQLEPGTRATPFERRSAGVELTLCERYYEIGNYLSNYYFNNSWAPATKNEHVAFRTTKRAVPVIGGTFTGGGWTGTWSTGGATNNGFWFGNNATINAGTFGHSATWTASAEL